VERIRHGAPFTSGQSLQTVPSIGIAMASAKAPIVSIATSILPLPAATSIIATRVEMPMLTCPAATIVIAMLASHGHRRTQQ
jgi:hypothetical protein